MASIEKTFKKQKGGKQNAYAKKDERNLKQRIDTIS